MKKMFAVTFGSLLAFNLLAVDPNVSDADQKWLTAVTKMVASGHSQVSTPSEARAQLLKDWAKKNDYSVQVTKADSSFRLELTKSVAKN